MRPAHIEGMGILGCFTALSLEHAGIPFTWHDNHHPQSAWQACTGAIYPAGKPGSIDAVTYRAWMHAYEQGGGRTHALLRNHMEEATYVFNHAQPPHEGRYSHSAPSRYPRLNMAEPSSLHLNAQTFVPAVRRRFAQLETRPVDAAVRHGNRHWWITAHGGLRITHYYWGWTRLIELNMAPLAQQRPALYLRKGRFVMCYAYPVPGTELWYAGSSLIRQTNRRQLNMVAKYLRWKSQLRELTGGKVQVAWEGDYLQGWRPAQASLKMEPDAAWVTVNKREVHLPPLWHSGIRHVPKVLDELMERLYPRAERIFNVDHR